MYKRQVNGLAALTGYASGWARKVQTGVVQTYASMIVVGILLVLGLIIFV